MNSGQIVLLGAIAGLTIFIGLPVGRMQSVRPATIRNSVLRASTSPRWKRGDPSIVKKYRPGWTAEDGIA